MRCCKKYPDFTTLSKKLSYLYGAELSGSVTKVGDTQCLNITVSGLDDRYAIDDESISAQLGELLCEIIFNPKVIGEAFCEDDLAQEKRQTLDMIDSEFSDKRVYASQRLIEEMCADEAFGIKRMGTKERVSAVTAQDVYRAWLNMLKTARFEFIFTGDADPNDVRNLIASKFFGKEISTDSLSIQHRLLVYTVLTGSTTSLRKWTSLSPSSRWALSSKTSQVRKI